MKKILTLGALLFGTSAFASDFRFSYDATDFSSPERFAAFHQRLQEAARSYCNAQYLKDRDLQARRACQADVMDIVVNEIGDQRLLAFVEKRGSQRS